MKQSHNSLDFLIEGLSKEFQKIPNFGLLNTDENAKRIFNLVIARFSEIQDFKSLYVQHFIPSTNKAIADSKREIQTSKYKHLIFVTDKQLKSNYYDIIRLGYVGLFHKMECYVKELLLEANFQFNNGELGEKSIENFYRLRYKYNFLDWYSDSQTHKINWISNCIKHYDGYPLKEPKHKYFLHLPENERIQINQAEFFADIDYVANNFYLFKLQQIISFSLFKMMVDMIGDNQIDDLTTEKYRDFENTIKLLMK